MLAMSRASVHCGWPAMCCVGRALGLATQYGASPGIAGDVLGVHRRGSCASRSAWRLPQKFESAIMTLSEVFEPIGYAPKKLVARLEKACNCFSRASPLWIRELVFSWSVVVRSSKEVKGHLGLG